MSKKHLKSWLKHGDFIVLDIICLQISFMLSYWLLHGFSSPYASSAFQYQGFYF